VTWKVPLADVRLPHAAVDAFLASLVLGDLGIGGEVSAFEEELAGALGAREAVAVSTGTAALHLVLRALGVGPGDEVIVPALTFVATASAVRLVGARPLLCDIAAPEEPLIDARGVVGRMTPRTRAVIAVHFGGYTADVAGLREVCDVHGVSLIEDCAHALGAIAGHGGRAAGTTGVAGCFSFGAKTQLPLGEGGAVVTDDRRLAERLRGLRTPASVPHWSSDDLGHDYGIADPYAALGRALLPGLPGDVEMRRTIARAYREVLHGCHLVRACFTDAGVATSAHFAFPVLAVDRRARDLARATLAAEGVQTTQYPALHRLTDWRATYGPSRHPHAEGFADRHLCLPIFPGLTPEAAQNVGELLRDLDQMAEA
jgi:dTDP-4-amino-4,6-dideoxygalactose transaminase